MLEYLEENDMKSAITKLSRAILPAVLAVTALAGCGRPNAGLEDSSGMLEINVSNRRPIAEAASSMGAGQYARSHSYYNANNLKAGMPVMFSASYGSQGGEAGQAKGRLVAGANGDLFFKLEDNPTNQLLYAPGLAKMSGVSLFNLTQYADLINRVSFAEAGGTDRSGQAVYESASGSVVDFRGGTAGSSTSYSDTMELVLKRKNRDSSSETKVYFAKGVGPVALEFREGGAVGGTFKIYIGQ